MQVEASQQGLVGACGELAAGTTDLQRRELAGVAAKAGLIQKAPFSGAAGSEHGGGISTKKRRRNGNGMWDAGSEAFSSSFTSPLVLPQDPIQPDCLKRLLNSLSAAEFSDLGIFANFHQEQISQNERIRSGLAPPESHLDELQDEQMQRIRRSLESRTMAAGFESLPHACEALRAVVAILQLRNLLQSLPLPALLKLHEVIPDGLAPELQMTMLTEVAQMLQQLPEETLLALRDGVLHGIAADSSATPQGVLMTLVQFEAEYFQLYTSLGLLLTLPERFVLAVAKCLPAIVAQPMQALLLLQMLLLPPFDALQFYSVLAPHNLEPMDEGLQEDAGGLFSLAGNGSLDEDKLLQSPESRGATPANTVGNDAEDRDDHPVGTSIGGAARPIKRSRGGKDRGVFPTTTELLEQAAAALGSEIDFHSSPEEETAVLATVPDAVPPARSGLPGMESTLAIPLPGPPRPGDLDSKPVPYVPKKASASGPAATMDVAHLEVAVAAAAAAQVPLASADTFAVGGPPPEWAGIPFEDIPREEKQMYVHIVDHPPERSVYKRNLKPNPMVVVNAKDGDDTVTTRFNKDGLLYVAIVLVRCDTFVEEPRYIVGNKPERVTSGRAVTFRKLKITTTSHQQQETLFCMRFELRRYAAGTTEDDISNESDKENAYYTKVLQNQKTALSRRSKKSEKEPSKLEELDLTGDNPPPRLLQFEILDAIHSNPICVLSHSTQMKPAQQQAVPQVRDVFPDAGPQSGGTRIAVLGANFVDSPAARVRFSSDGSPVLRESDHKQAGDAGEREFVPMFGEVMPIFHAPGTVLCHTPAHHPGRTNVSVCNASQKWSINTVVFEFVPLEMVAAATGAGNVYPDKRGPPRGADDADGGVLAGALKRLAPRISRLHHACWAGSADRVRELVAQVPDVLSALTSLDVRGYSPLHYAACSASVETVRVVLGALSATVTDREARLEAIARPCVRYGMSSLSWALWSDDRAVMAELQEFLGGIDAEQSSEIRPSAPVPVDPALLLPEHTGGENKRGAKSSTKILRLPVTTAVV